MLNMNYSKIKIRLLCTGLLVGAGIQVNAQHATSVCSRQININGNQYEYIIGESALITTESTSSLTVTQGFLQPVFQSSPTGGTAGNTGNHQALQPALYRVYPNPADSRVVVESLQPTDGRLHYQLYDATGKLLQDESRYQEGATGKFAINLESYSAGNYFLTIQTDNTNGSLSRDIFKIQKK
jgi:hypothetical protein